MKTDRYITFPECYKGCKIAESLGVGECEGICPWKFDTEGQPLKSIVDNKRKKEEEVKKDE